MMPIKSFLIAVILACAACHPAGSLRNGPLPDAHSCFEMSRPILASSDAAGPATVWLLLSDQSKQWLGARSFAAAIVEDGRRTDASWHRSAKDSIRVQWAESGNARTLELHERPDGVEGLADRKGNGGQPAQVISGRRASCSLAGER